MPDLFRGGRLLAGAEVAGVRLEDLVRHLTERGHAPPVVQQYVRDAAHFCRWLEGEGKGTPLSRLNEDSMHLFLEEHLPRCRCHEPRGRSHVRPAVGHLLRLLRQSRQVPERRAAPRTPVDDALEVFTGHLRDTCGMAPSTITIRVGRVLDFLQAKYGSGPVDPARLTPKDLAEYIAEQAAGVKPGTAKQVSAALRSFLRFWQLQGLCDARLVEALPMIPGWKLSQLPKLLTEKQLEQLLGSFDRWSVLGRRDYAMALCMIELGMRAGEVARLALDDIDWRAGTVHIRESKRRRGHLLPLPAKLARALVAYLRRGRPPPTQTRRLFVRHQAPVGAPIAGHVVGSAMSRAYDRAGLATPWKGAHTLRHTAASRWLRGGPR